MFDLPGERGCLLAADGPAISSLDEEGNWEPGK